MRVKIILFDQKCLCKILRYMLQKESSNLKVSI